MERRHGASSHSTGLSASAATMSGHSHGEHGMSAVFFNAMDTPLYSEMWTPASAAGYAATCIFLIVLAALMRGMLALKAIQETRWLDAELQRRYVVVNGKLPLAEQASQDSLARKMVLSENGVEQNVTVLQRKRVANRPWRFTVDPLRACMDLAIAGVGYLLMLAVMTMNIGYFMSVLGGVFLGSLLVGRFTAQGEH